MPEPNAVPLKGLCPFCRKPLRRYAAIGKGLVVEEKAVHCDCAGFMKRATTFGRTTFTATPDPRRVKAPIVPVKGEV